MKIKHLILLASILISWNAQCEKPSSKNIKYNFYIGTYTRGESKGIYQCHLNKDGSFSELNLSAEASNPTYLCWSADQQYLLAVRTVKQPKENSVASFKVNNNGLSFLSKSESGGAGPCFVGTNNEGYVLTANYGGGSVGLLKLDANGILSELLDVQQHTGKSVVESRQKGPHAHSAWFEPETGKIIACDLGTDELWFSTIDTKNNQLIPSKPQTHKMPAGAGPRHLCFHPNKKWFYVVNELDCTVMPVFKDKKGNYTNGEAISTLPNDFKEFNKCADIHISSDGAFLYASNRGHNSLAIYKIDKKDGSLCSVDYESIRGETPRNFSLTPDGKYMVVANQDSNNIVSFKRDKKTGKLTYIDEIEAPMPVCILFE